MLADRPVWQACRAYRNTVPASAGRQRPAWVRAKASGRHLHRVGPERAGEARRPTVLGDDVDIWRRLRVRRFDVQIPEAEVQKEYGEKLKAEGPAILNWMLDGYRLWRESGLVLPAVGQEATARYRPESDIVGQFIAAACVVTGNRIDTTPAIDMWDAYRTWCGRNAADQLSRTGFGRMLSEREGISKEHTRDGTVYSGVTLVDRSLLEGRHAEERGADDPGHADGA